MQQIVQVTKLLEPGYAEVFLERQSACSGDCHHCGGCGAQRERLFVRAENAIGAKPGDRVTVESDTGSVMFAVLLVYGLPVLLFFLGYGVGAALRWFPGLLGALGFLLGWIPCNLRNRRLMREDKTAFRIVGFAEE